MKHWITINEPWYFAYAGYLTGELPPGFVTTKNNGATQNAAAPVSPNSSQDDHEHSSICPPIRFSLKSSLFAAANAARIVQRPEDTQHWPYLVVHHQLLAHAKAVKLYRRKYQVLFLLIMK